LVSGTNFLRWRIDEIWPKESSDRSSAGPMQEESDKHRREKLFIEFFQLQEQKVRLTFQLEELMKEV
jgi:hypothetical protein